MSRLLAAASLLALLAAPAMAADGINSSNGTDLPMGAGSQTFVTLGAGQGIINGTPNNGYLLFGPNKSSPQAWINAMTGDSSFSGNLSIGGNIQGDLVVGGTRVNQRASAAEWSSVLEFGAPSGNNSDRFYFQRTNRRDNSSELVLYLGDDASNEFGSDVGDAFSIVASDYQGGGQYYTRYRFASNGKAYFDGSLQIKGQVADEETIAIANKMKSCLPGETIVKNAGGGVDCVAVSTSVSGLSYKGHLFRADSWNYLTPNMCNYIANDIYRSGAPPNYVDQAKHDDYMAIANIIDAYGKELVVGTTNYPGQGQRDIRECYISSADITANYNLLAKYWSFTNVNFGNGYFGLGLYTRQSPDCDFNGGCASEGVGSGPPGSL